MPTMTLIWFTAIVVCLALTEQVQNGFVRCHVYSGCGLSVLSMVALTFIFHYLKWRVSVETSRLGLIKG